MIEILVKTDHKGSESDVAKEMSKEELDPGKDLAAGGRLLLFFDRDFSGEMRMFNETWF